MPSTCNRASGSFWPCNASPLTLPAPLAVLELPAPVSAPSDMTLARALNEGQVQRLLEIIQGAMRQEQSAHLARGSHSNGIDFAKVKQRLENGLYGTVGAVQSDVNWMLDGVDGDCGLQPKDASRTRKALHRLLQELASAASAGHGDTGDHKYSPIQPSSRRFWVTSDENEPGTKNLAGDGDEGFGDEYASPDEKGKRKRR